MPVYKVIAPGVKLNGWALPPAVGLKAQTAHLFGVVSCVVEVDENETVAYWMF